MDSLILFDLFQMWNS